MKHKIIGVVMLAAASVFITSTTLFAAQVTINVEGMVCSACPQAVKAALERTPGVNRAKVTLESKEALVDYDEARIGPEKLVEVINKLGFRPTLQPQGEQERRK